MPITRQDLQAALRDPQFVQVLRDFVVGVSHDVNVGAVPGFGAGQNDTFDDRDNVDPTHPMNLSYFIPSNASRVARWLLSWRLHPFRTYNTFSATATGAGTSHFHNLNHTHSHNHSWHITFNAGINPNIGLNNAVPQIESTLATADIPVTTDATLPNSIATTPEAAHTHPVSINSTLGIFEGASPTNITLSFDGVDRTAVLGGPWSADIIELDVTKYIANPPQFPIAVWHSIALGSATLGQIEAKLRLSFYSNSAQGG